VVVIGAYGETVSDTDGSRRIRTSVRELTEGGLYPLSLRIVRECDSQGLWPHLPTGGRIHARCLGLFIVIEATEESGSVTPAGLANCTERLYKRAMREVTAEVKNYFRAECEHSVDRYRAAFRSGGIDPLVAEFCQRTQCDDAETISTMVRVSKWLLGDAARYLSQYEAVLEPA
jgi:hypothetical protein